MVKGTQCFHLFSAPFSIISAYIKKKSNYQVSLLLPRIKSPPKQIRCLISSMLVEVKCCPYLCKCKTHIVISVNLFCYRVTFIPKSSKMCKCKYKYKCIMYKCMIIGMQKNSFPTLPIKTHFGRRERDTHTHKKSGGRKRVLFHPRNSPVSMLQFFAWKEVQR